MHDLPAIWPNLLEILNIEKSKFLPIDVAAIVLKHIEIRRSTFRQAIVREDDEYTPWPSIGEEHPTQFYPNWNIFRYPKKYDVSHAIDSDFCDKAFHKARDFSYGVFSVGCSCPSNITYGFELMLQKESSHNIFRLLMCRDLDLYKLKGVIFDHSCGLDTYILNREPREFEYLRCLVDGSHWNGQKKLRKPDNSGHGGHMGCSLGYNYNLYKEHLPADTNSQGREQMHAVLQKLVPSLRQMSYPVFMTMMKVFFGINNLKRKGEV